MIPRWAQRYGYKERQVKNWLAAGRECGELPPFEDPAKLGDWFERRMGKVPKRLLRAIERELKGTAAEVPSPAPGPEVPEAFEVPEVDPSELGIEQQLESYRRELVLLGKLRRQALERGEFSRASGYLDQQNKVSQEIRQLEKMLPDLLQQRGDLRSSAEVRRSTVEMLKVLRTALIARGRKGARRFLALSSERQASEVWEEELDAAFREACACGFEETLVLES